jgi:hypothetical protein
MTSNVLKDKVVERIIDPTLPVLPIQPPHIKIRHLHDDLMDRKWKSYSRVQQWVKNNHYKNPCTWKFLRELETLLYLSELGRLKAQRDQVISQIFASELEWLSTDIYKDVSFVSEFIFQAWKNENIESILAMIHSFLGEVYKNMMIAVDDARRVYLQKHENQKKEEVKENQKKVQFHSFPIQEQESKTLQDRPPTPARPKMQRSSTCELQIFPLRVPIRVVISDSDPDSDDELTITAE